MSIPREISNAHSVKAENGRTLDEWRRTGRIAFMVIDEANEANDGPMNV